MKSEKAIDRIFILFIIIWLSTFIVVLTYFNNGLERENRWLRQELEEVEVLEVSI